MRKIRIALQLSFLTLFLVAFFVFNTNPLAYSFDSEFFLRFNPLSGLLTMIASRAFIMPLAIFTIVMLLCATVFGRFFCGFLCPLGAMIDFCDRYLFSHMRSLKRRPPKFLQRLKYVFLTVLILLALFGVLFPLFMDPLALSTRILTLLIHPLLNIMGVDLLQLTSLLSPSLSNSFYSAHPIEVPLYYSLFLTASLVVVVFCSSFWDTRFWCQYICPTGAFFGVLSRFSLFRRKTRESHCNTCSRCVKACPVRAINEKDVTKTNVAECIECGICVQLKESCSSFQIALPTPDKNPGPDLHRRHFLSGVSGGLLMLPLFRATAINKSDSHGRLIRPPGAIPESKFLARCIACGECMKVCPTNALQPCTFVDGFSRLYTPKVVPRIAGCEEKCSLCGNVCPTGAIRKIAQKQKQFIKIGTAVVDRHRCLAWEQNKECLVCDEVCPYNAIEARVVNTVKGSFKVPVVNQDLCMGCGLCEQHCPVFDTAAIVVYKFGENRRSQGDYMTQYQMDRLSKLRLISDKHHLGNEFENSYGSGNHNESYGTESGVSNPGFTD